jgi:hypothetical protein
METTSTATDGRDEFSDDELRALRRQLASLVSETKDYPLECAVGSFDLLFESRDDIEMILDTLPEGSA